jgi:uncharacterized glyoxalase superfamily protein PhnB
VYHPLPEWKAVMKITSYYPVLMSADVPAAVAFYSNHLHFTALFTADWYVHLQSKLDPSINLAILARDHHTIPPTARGQTGGMLLNFELEDVDAQYVRLTDAGVTIALTLRDEDFGQRHFIVQAPDGVLIDIIRPIPPSDVFVAQFAPEALPR